MDWYPRSCKFFFRIMTKETNDFATAPASFIKLLTIMNIWHWNSSLVSVFIKPLRLSLLGFLWLFFVQATSPLKSTKKNPHRYILLPLSLSLSLSSHLSVYLSLTSLSSHTYFVRVYPRWRMLCEKIHLSLLPFFIFTFFFLLEKERECV